MWGEDKATQRQVEKRRRGGLRTFESPSLSAAPAFCEPSSSNDEEPSCSLATWRNSEAVKNIRFFFFGAWCNQEKHAMGADCGEGKREKKKGGDRDMAIVTAAIGRMRTCIETIVVNVFMMMVNVMYDIWWRQLVL